MFKKFVIFALVATLVITALPLTSAAAAPLHDDPQPGTGNDSYPRLEKAYTKIQDLYARQGEFLAKVPERIAKVEALLQKATEKGFDVSAIQTALDAFKASLPAAQAAHDKAGQILATHAGFDDNGKVTDLALARQTVKDAGAALKEARQAHLSAGQALREALKAFREAHQPANSNNGNGNRLPAPAQP